MIARNVRLPGGEIDVIARDGDAYVFVEVKARASQRFGTAIGAGIVILMLNPTSVTESVTAGLGLTGVLSAFGKEA